MSGAHAQAGNMSARKGIEVRYAAGGAALNVRLIAGWNRGDVQPVSGGSGLKDYVKNRVYLIFEQQPKVDRVVMVRASGPPFLLLRVGEHWFDVMAKEVAVRGVEAIA
jgi:hypothetical protein